MTNMLALAAAVAVILMGGMVALIDAGRRIGLRQLARDSAGARPGVGAVEGAVFALLGLLIGFTFSGAAGRFDARRHLVGEEANAIGTAWLRIDLLPPDAQPRLRELFRKYLDSRLEMYRRLPDIQAAETELTRSKTLQGEIWTEAVSVAGALPSTYQMLLLVPALNEMIDITTTRTVAMQMHPPVIVFVMLCALALVSALLAGLGMAGGRERSWIHVIGYAVIIAATVYVIIDIEYPRLGLIRVDAVDQVLRDVRQSMK